MAFIKQQQKSFDPDNALMNAATSLSFDQQFITEVQKHIRYTTNAVIHFGSDDICSCQQRASLHIELIQDRVKTLQKINYQWDINQWPIARRFIPSYPAIAIFDAQGKLTYLGPYSSGLGCSSNNSQLEKYLSITKRQTPAAIINSESSGCYCQRQQSIII